MIQTDPPDMQAEVEQTKASFTTELTPRAEATSSELFLRTVVVVVGIFLGIIVAVFVGLATGWIPFNC